MFNRYDANRVELLTRKANLLRGRAKQLTADYDDDTLWMSSLDIIDELLDTVQGLMQQTDDGTAAHPNDVLMLCPHCHTTVNLPFDVVATGAATCPVCGDTILLTNPT